MEKKTPVGPVSLTPPTLPIPQQQPVRSLPASPPETCCYAHDAASNKHDLTCVVGMVYRIDADGLGMVFDGFTHSVQRAAHAVADMILAVQMGGVPAAKAHAAIETFNKLHEKAVEAQNIIRDRESAR